MQATSITTSNSSGSVVATGVKFKGSSDGQEYEVSVGREVVVSAGAIQVLPLLDLLLRRRSDLVNPSHRALPFSNTVVSDRLLSSRLPELTSSSTCRVWDATSTSRLQLFLASRLPTASVSTEVGPRTASPSPPSISCVSSLPFQTWELPLTELPIPFVQLFPDDAEAVKTNLSNSISRYAADAFAAGAVVSQEAGEALFEVQRKLIVDGQVGLAELFFDSGFPNGGFGLDTWGLLPFARGTVEIIVRPNSSLPLTSLALTRCCL